MVPGSLGQWFHIFVNAKSFVFHNCLTIYIVYFLFKHTFLLTLFVIAIWFDILLSNACESFFISFHSYLFVVFYILLYTFWAHVT